MPALDATPAASIARLAREALEASGLSALVVSSLARETQRVAGGPRLSSSSGELLREIEVTDEFGDHRSVQIPVERGLAVFLDGRQVGKLWTLGAQPDWLGADRFDADA